MSLHWNNIFTWKPEMNICIITPARSTCKSPKLDYILHVWYINRIQWLNHAKQAEKVLFFRSIYDERSLLSSNVDLWPLITWPLLIGLKKKFLGSYSNSLWWLYFLPRGKILLLAEVRAQTMMQPSYFSQKWLYVTA